MINFNQHYNLNRDICYGDKSISHRALIVSAIAKGQSTLCNLSLCQDVLTTANCLRTLGATISISGTTAKVTPITPPNDKVTLDCQNSGTTARLLAGVVAGLGISATFVGDESLTKRPMDRIINPLKELGAVITKSKGELFTIHSSKLVGKVIDAKVNSAQVKSCLLLAGLFADGVTQYVEKIPTRNHTELLLKSCGVDVTNCSVHKAIPNAMDITIPNDISSCANLVALALLKGQNLTFPNVCVNDGRVGFITVLQRAGANIYLENQKIVYGEKVADICLKSGKFEPLYANEMDVCNAIDEVPILCAMAIATKGKHLFCGVKELQHKECDRIQAIVELAKSCNQQAKFDGENLTIVSNGILPQNPIFKSFNDHRIAMCGAILSIACGGGSVDSFPVEVSFPNFMQAIGVVPKRFCVIGGDVSKSMSPTLMQHLAQKSGVCCSYDKVSLPADVTDEQLLDTISKYDGVNVTIPFKRRVATLTESNLPSVNTVCKYGLSTSTDGYGVEMALLQNGVDIAGKKLWIVGAGGGAEACIQRLVGKCQMQIINRTQSNADFLTQKYNLSEHIDQPDGVLSFVPECEFEQSIVLPQSCKFVFVSAYVGKSNLKMQAKKYGITIVDGLQMLYHQGAKSFSLWTNTPIQNDYQSFRATLGEK